VSAFIPRLLKNASRELKKLDPPVAKRIVEQIAWLSEHFEEVKAEALKGELAGLFKYREGDYRIIYQPLHKEKVIVIHEIGHRSEIYKRAKA
jgi:mRNA interferase RelE/StbE